MLRVADCILQFLYERKKTMILKLIIFNICERKMSGVWYIDFKKMGEGKRIVNEVHL